MGAETTSTKKMDTSTTDDEAVCCVSKDLSAVGYEGGWCGALLVI